MADNKPEQEEQELSKETNAQEPLNSREIVRKSFNSQDLLEAIDRYEKYLDAQELPEEYRAKMKNPESIDEQRLLKIYYFSDTEERRQILTFMERYAESERKPMEREKRFFTSYEFEAAKIAFPGNDFKPGTKETNYVIGIIDGAENMSFPYLRKNMDPAASYSEASKLDPAYTRTQPMLYFYELLWHHLYNTELPDETDSEPAAPAAAADPAPTDETQELEKIIVKRPDNVQYPLDKLNSSIWQLLEDTHGQLTFAMEAKRGSKNTRQTLDCIYSIDFSALEQEGVKITRRLTPFDKRVYIAVAALYNMGNDVITLRQIFFAMGQKASNPKGEQLRKINESLTKMTWARVTVDDSQEHNRYNYNLDEGGVKNGWKHGRYDGSFLPFERAAAVANGKVTDAAIHLFREPPMLSFAKMRNQITTIELKLLQSPISKTDSNLAIEDYLITRLSWARRAGKDFLKIRFKTLFEKAGIVEKNQRQRAPGKIEKYLQYYQKEGKWITGYTITRDSITVYFKGGPPKDPGGDPDGEEPETDPGAE